MNVFSKLRDYYQRLKGKFYVDHPTKKFIEHNKMVWGNQKILETNKVILVEMTFMTTSIVACSYFANILADKYKAKIVAHRFPCRIKNRVEEKVYKSFNTSQIIVEESNNYYRQEVEKIFSEVIGNIKTKKDLLELNILGIDIGIDIYSSYLRDDLLPTVNLGSSKLNEYIKKGIETVIRWQQYFSTQQVEAVLMTHPCYIQCVIVGKVARAFGVPVYICGATLGIRFDNQFYLGKNFKNYRKIFKNLSHKEQLEGIDLAKNRLERRFSGEVGVDMPYSKVSSFSSINNKNILAQNKKIKVLICSHCFFDYPFGYGKMLFTDFYEWLCFLGNISNKTDYDWYLKVHPDYYYWPGSLEYTEEILSRYPKIKMIPPETSHLQLAKEGIEFVLTVHGTVGSEYPLLGVQVINASTNNPHIAYDFNWHPATIDEYEKMLMNLNDLHLNIKEEDVYEFYYMHHFVAKDSYIKDNLIFTSYAELLKNAGTDRVLNASTKTYQAFLDEFSTQRHKEIIANVKGFIEDMEKIYLNDN